MRNQLDNLEEAEMNFEEIVSTTIYLDDLAELHAFDEVYAQYLGSPLPARTVVQQIAPVKRTDGQSTDKKDGTYPDFEQVSLIAVRKSFHQ